ncbi:PH domain-containing protein [Salinimicrobium catena]|uniref:PH domain-containing protein n=1 Tax=Salinimicrobium catena TaxID=390640 RepID=UPI002FE44826
MDPVRSGDFSNLEVDVASLPQYEQVKLHSLSKKYLLKLHINTSISLTFFMGGILVASFFLTGYRLIFWLVFGFFVLLFGWSYYNNYQLAKRNGYGLRERDVIYRRGFIFEKVTVVPFNRIQHVSVERNFLDKLLNISTLKIFTAGGSGSDVNIPGLPPETATALKEEISERISGHA